MKKNLFCQCCFAPLPVMLLLAGTLAVQANPVGGVVSQGSASITSAGSQLTVNQTSANAFINWQSFNLDAG